MVKGHFHDEDMKVSNARAVHTYFVMAIVKTRVGGGGTFPAALPVTNEVIATYARGNWGCPFGNLQDGDELLHIEIHPCQALVGTLQNSLSSWEGSKEAKLIAEGVGQEWGVGNKLKVESQDLTEMLLNLLLGC